MFDILPKKLRQNIFFGAIMKNRDGYVNNISRL